MLRYVGGRWQMKNNISLISTWKEAVLLFLYDKIPPPKGLDIRTLELLICEGKLKIVFNGGG